MKLPKNESGFTTIVLIVEIVVVLIITVVSLIFMRSNNIRSLSQVQNSLPLSQPSPATSSSQTSCDASCQAIIDKKISVLKTDLLKTLQQQNNQTQAIPQVANLTPPVTVTTPAPVVSAAKTPIFIPLGSADPMNDQGWKSIDALSTNIDPADYPGYISMQLEIGLRLNQGSGTANARLFNTGNQSAVGSSSVSTSSTNFIILTSGTFTLPAGKNLYKIQGMSSTGDTMYIQNARIRVNFN